MKVAVVGGGAAGFFAAIHLAEICPDAEVHIFEKGQQILGKVRVSGGGRCNVTHACFDVRQLVKYYPRGSKELLGPFHRFGPQDTINWFADRGVELKTEEDGRMFPVTDSSQTIIDSFLDASDECGLSIHTQSGLMGIEQLEYGWKLTLDHNKIFVADAVLLAGGSSSSLWNLLAGLGLKMINPVPSLFTFHIPDKSLRSLSGVSIENVELKIPGFKYLSDGPLLFTHWGLSGPSILKLSAFAARYLNECDYQSILTINFLPDYSDEEISDDFNDWRQIHSRRQVGSQSPFASIPKRCWHFILEKAKINDTINWADVSNKQIRTLVSALIAAEFEIRGKSTFKEEFVTCGGVSMDEINTKNFEARRYPGLFFAGEILNVDAVTGGFNFQHAWTSGWIAAEGIAEKLRG